MSLLRHHCRTESQPISRDPARLVTMESYFYSVGDEVDWLPLCANRACISA